LFLNIIEKKAVLLLENPCLLVHKQGELALPLVDQTVAVAVEVVGVTLVVINHQDKRRPSFKATALTYEARYLIAVTINKLILSSIL
jgi:hypothetical protein